MATRKKKNLVIVESPAKARTINKYLGADYEVVASKGHVRDLPKTRFGIDIEGGWVPTYRPLKDRKEVLDSLKKQAAKAGTVFLAPDPDREGEAIAWHLKEALGLDDKRARRVTFNEITKGAVKKAFAEAGKIDMDRVAAQEARRFLDRVVGYRLSPLLSRKLAQHLSAGRVQSVTLRLIVDREREIQNFKPEEYWKIITLLQQPKRESARAPERAPRSRAPALRKTVNRISLTNHSPTGLFTPSWRNGRGKSSRRAMARNRARSSRHWKGPAMLSARSSRRIGRRRPRLRLPQAPCSSRRPSACTTPPSER